jgi:hypothetical protein
MWESQSDFQEPWEGRKTCRWFSVLSMVRHFNGLVRLRSFLLFVGGAPEPVGFRAGL